MSKEIRQTVLEAIDKSKEETIRLAQLLHDNPELAFSEFFAVETLTTALSRHGLSVEKGAGGLKTAFLARTRGKGQGPKIGIIAEYDALPGIGHGCGHNLIAGAAFASVVGLTTVMRELDGEALFIGTPAEESGGGKAIMIDAGIFKEIDVVLAVHGAGNETTVASEPNTGRSLGMTPLKIEFVGKAAHAGMSPEKGINALNALIKVFTGIDALRQHVTPDVRIHGIITDGGEAPNMVPSYSSAKFFVRAADYRNMAAVVQKIESIVKGAELMTGARGTVTIEGNVYKDISPNLELGKMLAKNMKELGVDVVPSSTTIDTFSTDVGNVSHEVPTGWAMFTISNAQIPHHSKEYAQASEGQLAYQNMLLTAKAMALTTVDLLTKSGIVVAAKTEFASKPA